MEKTSATSRNTLASTARPVDAHQDKPKEKSPNSAFNMAAIGMSWQLAVIVLLPIVGGYYLDQRTGTMPWLTVTGLVLALAGSIIVIRRALSIMNNFNVEPDKTEDK